MDDIIDDIGDFFEDALDFIEEVAETVWREIGAPLLEEIANFLGFEDETIIVSYVVTQRMYGNDWIVPWKKIPINRIRYNTDWYDEIINVFISGDHIRIKSMNSKVARIGWTPTIAFSNGTIDTAELDIIITAEVGQPITIQYATVGFPSLINYGKEYLINNELTTGYTYDTLLNTLDDGAGTVYTLHETSPFIYDVLNDAYDVSVYGDRVLFGDVVTARNTVADLTPTYNVSGGVVTIDTAKDNAIVPIYSAVNTPAIPGTTYAVNGFVITINTATDRLPGRYQGPYFYFLEGQILLQELIPAQVAPRKQYEVVYTIDADPTPRPRYIWFYTLEDPPRQYPSLYASVPAFPEGNDRLVLPIVPIKVEGQWVADLGNQLETDTRSVLKRFGFNLSRITRGFEEDPNGNSDDIRSVFIMFGINIITAETQVERNYLFNFFTEFAYTSTGDLSITEFEDLLDDIALARLYKNNRVASLGSGGDEGNESFYYFRNTPDLEDLITDPSLINADDWIFGTGWEHIFTPATGGDQGNPPEGYIRASDATGNLEHIVSAISDRTYNVAITVENFIQNGATFTPYLGGTAGTAITEDGDYDITIIAGSTNNLFQLIPSGDLRCRITSLSVRSYEIEQILIQYLGPDWPSGNLRFNWSNDFWTRVGLALDELLEVMDNIQLANRTSYTIIQGDFNVTISYGKAIQETITGVIGDVDEVVLVAEETNYIYRIQKQITPTTYDEIRMIGLIGFSYIRFDGDQIQLARLDFVGSDDGGQNVANNFVVPITYGFLLSLGIVDRQHLLYQAAHIEMFAVNITELRYYETEDFLEFFDIVLKVAAVIYVIYTGDASGANILFTLAKAYGTKILLEMVMQRILLAFPDSALAQALAVVIAVVATAFVGGVDMTSFGLDQALLTIDATSQVFTTYNRVQTDLINQELEELNTTSRERLEEIQDAIDELDPRNPALLEYIQEQITISILAPGDFYRKSLNRSLVEEALNLDTWVDVEALLQLDKLPITTTREI